LKPKCVVLVFASILGDNALNSVTNGNNKHILNVLYEEHQEAQHKISSVTLMLLKSIKILMDE
jgi:hypothetical protein